MSTAMIAALCACGSVLALSGSSAFGAFTHRYLSSFGSFSDIGAVTVDQATGDVYVLDVGKGEGSLYKFDASGQPAEFSALKTNVIEGVGGVSAKSGGALKAEIAVDGSTGPAKGDIYVARGNANGSAQKLEIYGADGTSLGELSGVEACGVAVDPAGNLYVGARAGVRKYTPSGNPASLSDYVSELQTEETARNDLLSLAGEACGVAADSEGNLYVNDFSFHQEEGNFEGIVARFQALQFGSLSPVGTYVDMRGGALATDPASNDVYVDGSHGVVQYDSSSHELGSFGLSGPGALSTSFGIAIDGSSGDVFVSDNVNGRIEVFGPDVVLPDVRTGDVANLTSSGSATLVGTVNPLGLEITSCRFEYGTSLAYGSSVPCHVDPGSGSSQVTVNADASALTPGAVYQYRLVAEDTNGSTQGSDMMFSVPGASDSCANAATRSTQFSSYLPDCRAYEMASPVEKGTGGANIAVAARGETQSAVDGNGIKYFSGTAFGDSQGIEGRGAEYVSRRAADGWTTHGVTPKMAALAYEIFAGPQYEAFSPDLSKGVLLAYKPVTSGNPNVEHVANLYLLTDTSADPPGVYDLLSLSTEALPAQPEVPGNPEVSFIEASADFSHILLESNHDLTSDASGLSPNVPKVYEWVDGTLTLAGILPNGAPAEESTRGRGPGYPGQGSMSTDGTRFVFSGFQSEGGHSVGNLYLSSTRSGKSTTVRLNESERAIPDPAGPKSAILAGATPDDSKVFFFSTEALTEGTNSGGLYRYDVNASEGQHLTLIVPNISQLPLDGISEDGEYVYFLAGGELIPGQPKIRAREALYVWHDAGVRFVAEYSGSDLGWGQGRPGEYNGLRISRDGRYVAFESVVEANAVLAGASIRVSEEKDAKCLGVGSKFFCGKMCWPTNTCGQVFVYSYPTNSLTCASCNPSGADPSSVGSFESEFDSEAFAPTSQYLTNAMSRDGRYVFFDTSDPLVPRDTNNQRDVYEYDIQAHKVFLISSGSCACASTFADASPDGSNVFFTTHQQLVRADVDAQGDMYDARIDGGIPSQNVAPIAPCEGDDCQGPANVAPVFSLPSSATFAGAGNALAPVSKPTTKQKKKAKPHKKVRPHRKKAKPRGKRHAKAEAVRRISRRAGR
jgi:hypothetical protein